MAADRPEAAAYGRDIGRRVEHEQLTQGVDEHYLRIWPDGLLARTGRETNSPLTQRVGNCREALRMPWHEHEQRVREALADDAMRCERSAFFALVRARRDPDRTLSEPFGAPRPSGIHGVRRHLDVELEIAHDLHVHGTDRAESLCIRRGLRRHTHALERGAGDTSQESVAPHRFL